MMWTSKTLIFMALPILSICAATLFYFQSKDKEWEAFIKNQKKKQEAGIKLPIANIGNLIGKAGIRIQQLQSKTNTKIYFKSIEGDVDHKMCVIIGEQKDIENAKSLIIESLQPKFDYSCKMSIPKSAVSHIIGRGGDNIRQITFVTKTVIKIDHDKNGSNFDYNFIYIKGDRENVALAKDLIEKKVEEHIKRQNEQSISNPGKSAIVDREMVTQKHPGHERLITESSESMIEVYVSSVANPSHFWLQLITPRAVDLDHLVDNMTEYYSKEENRALHRLSQVSKGQIVVCKYENDGKYYRVEAFFSHGDLVDVFYVDYGDSCDYPLKDLYEIKPEFLDLKFQAIEVGMAGINSIGEHWTEEAIEVFEDKVYTAQWKAVFAQIVDYKDCKKSTRPGPIPLVKLYHPDGPPGIDIGRQLVESGLAVAVKTEEPGSLQYEGAGTEEEASSPTTSEVKEFLSDTSTDDTSTVKYHGDTCIATSDKKSTQKSNLVKVSESENESVVIEDIENFN